MKRARNRRRSAAGLAWPRPGGGGQNRRMSAAAPLPQPFVHRQAIRFSHCDPGGTGCFPHYFEMVYEAIEDWFDAEIEPNLETRLRQEGIGFPTVNTQCDFLRPSRVGDVPDLELTVARIGRASPDLALRGRSDGEERLRARNVRSMMSLETYRALPIAGDLRRAMAPFVCGAPA